MKQYLLEDRQLSDIDTVFSVKRMGKMNWFWVIFLTIMVTLLNLSIFNFFIPGFGSIIFLLSPVIIIISYRRWKITGKKMIDGIVIENAKIWMHHENQIDYHHERGFLKDKLFNMVSYLLGANFKTTRTYYLEGNVENSDLSRRSILRRKYLDLFSACLGITFLIATSVRSLVTTDQETIQGVIMALAAILIPFSIYLVSWLIPMFWTIQDANIKSIDNKKVIHDFSQEIRDGFISRFLGFAGFIIAFSESYRTAQLTREEGQFFVAAILGNGLLATVYLILFILVILGTSVFLASIYLSRVHEERVNYLRKELSKILYLGSTSVRLFNDEELIDYFDLHETRSASNTMVGEVSTVSIDDDKNQE